MKIEGLDPRTSYKITGEQIDGAFVFGNKVYLLEAKWHKDDFDLADNKLLTVNIEKVYMGKYTVSHVASSIKNSIESGSKLIMVTDSDGDIFGTKEKFRKIVEYKKEELIVINDKIEIWLENGNENLKKTFERLKFDEKLEIISQRITKLDIEKLKDNNDSFNQFYSVVARL